MYACIGVEPPSTPYIKGFTSLSGPCTEHIGVAPDQRGRPDEVGLWRHGGIRVGQSSRRRRIYAYRTHLTPVLD